jgi:hypothetical protein
MVFEEELLNSTLEKYASKRAKAMYAWIGHFRAITSNQTSRFYQIQK